MDGHRAYHSGSYSKYLKAYDLTPFGTLSPGKYKLVKDDLEAEFELTEEE